MVQGRLHMRLIGGHGRQRRYAGKDRVIVPAVKSDAGVDFANCFVHGSLFKEFLETIQRPGPVSFHAGCGFRIRQLAVLHDQL